MVASGPSGMVYSSISGSGSMLAYQVEVSLPVGDGIAVDGLAHGITVILSAVGHEQNSSHIRLF